MVDRIRIEGLPTPFLKRVRLEAGGDRARWTLLDEQATLFDLPDEGLRLLELDFRPGEYRYLRLVWSDRSSGRLPLPRRVGARLLQGSPPPPPLEIQLNFEKRASEPGSSRYRVFLPAAGLPITGLELEVETSYVLRRARVTEARLFGSEIRPVDLGQTMLRRVVHEDLVASQMEIPISMPMEAEVEIEIEDGDNPPLELKAITVRFAPQPWIYFESPDGEPITARYGAAGLRAPSYDLVALQEALGAEGLALELASLVQGHRVHHVHELGQVGLVRQGQGLRSQRGVQLAIREDALEGVPELRIQGQGASRLVVGHLAEHDVRGQLLARLPTVEEIRVVAHEEAQLLVAQVGVQAHGGRESAQQRGHRPLLEIGEDELLLRLGEVEHAVRGRLALLALQESVRRDGGSVGGA